jgi:hypothetical protein
VAALVAVGATLLTVSTVSASSWNAHYAAVRAAPSASRPTSKIEGSGKQFSFKPSSLSAKWSGSTEGTCTTAKESFVVANTTSTSQTFTYEGTVFGNPIPASGSEGICAWGAGTVTAVFSLKADSKRN